MKRNQDIQQLRNLAHQLRYETETRLPSARNPLTLADRVGRMLNTEQAWVQASDLEQGCRLHARAERVGLGRKYIEEVVLTVRQTRLTMTMTRWVNERDRDYHGGSWNFQEDLNTGHYDCRFTL